MSSKLQLVITENNEVLQTVTQEVNTNDYAQSLEEFQIAANATLTKMIEDLGHIDSNELNMDEDEESSDIEEDIQHASPKKIKM